VKDNRGFSAVDIANPFSSRQLLVTAGAIMTNSNAEVHSLRTTVRRVPSLPGTPEVSHSNFNPAKLFFRQAVALAVTCVDQVCLFVLEIIKAVLHVHT